MYELVSTASVIGAVIVGMLINHVAFVKLHERIDALLDTLDAEIARFRRELLAQIQCQR